MESSISAVTYKGSIPEAILESKKQKKLFVVYISGENVESAELEKSTWADSKVESLSKYCILLHIKEGSTDAMNLSAIYPQKSAPCITAIGYNGVQLWQSEGFVSAEVLASGLEKARLSLHIQETTATVLTAALALKKSEPPSSGSSDIGSSGQGSSSGTVVSLPLVESHAQPSELETQAASELIEEKASHEQPTAEETITNLDDKTSTKSFNVHKSQATGDEWSTCPPDEDNKLPSSITKSDHTIADHIFSGPEDGLLAQEKIIGNHSGATTEIKEAGGDKKAESTPGTLDDKKTVTVLSDVHLNIRLPDGVSLQEKFSVTSTLRMVKNYVDRNQASGIGAYDLAIPYPRKTFSDQDLSKSLSELALLNRQALMVVPHQRATSYHRGGSSSDRATSSGSANANDGGYFAYVKRVLSYVNPLSYFGGSASSSRSGQAQSGIWEYSPYSTPQNNTARTDRPDSSYSPNQNSSATGRNDSQGRPTTTSRIGSNIHTLKHDGDDGRFNDRNSFWNGNSTEYGGNSDGK
ncbi:PREDICTED: UBX domain-containing protein 4-like isoform X2 [Populus euphratica]|uniref:UBX domain-containing protein 4-like isoform X2 n=1 Tax=Populus euphratica TaxID=75702 RepID=A0AAJ6UY08_POPEU|nr:PREDICTED: UBX domain-containing protein 4-like isoform X2 [Populus euphratica]